MARRDPGSFRDPSGTIFASGGTILRSVNGEALQNFLQLKSSGAYDDLVGRGWIVGADVAGAELVATMPETAPGAHALVHPRLPFISYPYEWPFALLKRAALLHLDIQLRALDFGFTLSDASAYNVQFAGYRPVFIDIPPSCPIARAITGPASASSSNSSSIRCCCARCSGLRTMPGTAARSRASRAATSSRCSAGSGAGSRSTSSPTSRCQK